MENYILMVMSLLPGRIVPSTWLLVAGFLLLGTSYLLPATQPVSAQSWSISLSLDCSNPSANLFYTATIPFPAESGEDGIIKLYKNGTLVRTHQDFAPGSTNYPLGLYPPGNYYATIHDTAIGPILATSNTVTIDDSCRANPWSISLTIGPCEGVSAPITASWTNPSLGFIKMKKVGDPSDNFGNAPALPPSGSFVFPADPASRTDGTYYAELLEGSFDGPVRATSNNVVLSCPGIPLPSPTPLPPNIKACKNALYTDKLTKVVLEPIERTFTAEGKDGDPVTFNEEIPIDVDFSKLAAIFAAPNSNYPEGQFQSESHRLQDILGLKSQDFNTYHGPGQKAAPKVMTDQLKVKYVEYVYQKPELAESDNKYADINGQNPKTISDLVNTPNFSNPPQPPSWGGDPDTWNQTWGLYWEKIPTAVSEFYYGLFTFPLVKHEWNFKAIEEGKYCPKAIRIIYFVMPEYFRTTSVANQLNQLIVPNAVQSSEADFVDKNLFAGAINETKIALAKIIQGCIKPFTNNPLAKTLRKVIKNSFNFLNPVKTASAAPIIPPKETLPDPCPKAIPILPNDKRGSGPFCSLPPLVPANVKPPPGSPQPGEPQLQPGESCTDVNDPNKLDEGTLVICTFKAHFSETLHINRPGDFDECKDEDGDGTYQCTIKVRIYPMFYIPWLAPIWNNTTYSDKNEQDIGAVFNTQQETGKPGTYTFFKPKAVDDTVFPKGKNLPSEEQNSDQDIKQRFFGATDCNKEFTRDVALKPKALQEFLGVKTQCEAE